MLNLVNAIKVSSDDFFYNLGALTNATRYAPKGGALQQWAHAVRDRPPDGDRPAAARSRARCPRRLARHGNKLETECDNAIGPFKAHGRKHQRHRAAAGSPTAEPPWSVGDNENLAVGQGDVQVTPLQLAVAYSALANGGTIVNPHLGLDIQHARRHADAEASTRRPRATSTSTRCTWTTIRRACGRPPRSRAGPRPT